MSRYLYGENNPASAPVATASAIEVGDILGYTSGNVYPAKDETWDTNLATTQTAFATKFLGLSGQKKLASEVRVHGNSTDNIEPWEEVQSASGSNRAQRAARRDARFRYSTHGGNDEGGWQAAGDEERVDNKGEH